MNIFAPTSTQQIQLLGAQYCKMSTSSSRRLASRGHHVWILELMMKGRLQIGVEKSDWITLNENSGVLYAPGTRYREKVFSNTALCQSIALFFEMGNPPLAEPWDRFQESFLTVQDEEKLLLPLAENCLNHLGLGVVDGIEVTANFLHIMAHLLRAEKREEMLIVASEYPGGDIVARAHQYMRQRLGESVQLDQIAAAVGMSVSGFAHSYKRKTGISPMTMLRLMRVESAKTFLMRDRLSLGQIAVETGFADAFHLSRTFKEITGVSPRQFRNKMNIVE